MYYRPWRSCTIFGSVTIADQPGASAEIRETVDWKSLVETDMNQKLPRQIVRPIQYFILALIALTGLEVAGIVTPRGFAILCLVAMMIASIVFYRVLKTAASALAPNERGAGLSKRKRWYVLSAALLWLVFATWLTRGEPWLPRLVGATVVIVFIAPYALPRRR